MSTHDLFGGLPGEAVTIRRRPRSREELQGKRIGVLMGGQSAEREVSLLTGAAMLQALNSRGYDPVSIDVGPDVAAELREQGVEIAVLAVHGKLGEDGALQGMLEVMRIPYTGSGVLASALAMDKVFSKHVFEGEGLPTPPYEVVRVEDGVTPAEPAFGFPCVVKPKAEGSSVGVSIVRGDETYASACALAGQYDRDVLVERYVAGRELCVGVLDDTPLGVIEIRPHREFYDYQAKYHDHSTEYLCPAPLDEVTRRRVVEVSLRANAALGCSGVTRADLMLDTSGEAWLLEINTLPGMTDTSLVPKLAAANGIEFAELVERLAMGACLDS